jgi:nicotinamidase-related amidase
MMDPPQCKTLIERDDSILVVVDLQEGFLRKLDADRAEMLVDNCRFLVEVANRLCIPTFVTVESADRNGPTTESVRSVLGTSVPERAKAAFGLCGQPDLRVAILEQSRRTAVLVGLETDVCVLQSAVGLLNEGFRTVVVADATGSPGVEHDLGLARAETLGAELIHTKGLFYEWVRTLEVLTILESNGKLKPPLGSVL